MASRAHGQGLLLLSTVVLAWGLTWPVTSLGLLATPVVSVITATLWLGEPLTPSLVAAIVLVLGGIAIGATGRRA